MIETFVRQTCCVQGRIQSRSAFDMSNVRTPISVAKDIILLYSLEAC